MQIKITMLNVKDGDSIIVELTKSNISLVIVIDGGDYGYYQTKVKPALEIILKAHHKKAPDIVVCTHFDSDHIGGLIPLITDYISDISEVWVHKIPATLNTFIKLANQINDKAENSTNHYDFADFNMILKNYDVESKRLFWDNANKIIKSLPQLKKLLDLIPHSKLKHVFHKQKPLIDWPEIIILGPTKTYYNSLFPKTKTFSEFLLEEVLECLPREKLDLKSVELENNKACDALKKDADTHLTPTNKASIIIAIDQAEKRYLFTGDAGIESFKAIPDWQTELKNLYFLKIPHHASDNNVSKELIELMQPEYAYNTGFDYQDDPVLKCFAEKKRNKKVKSTKIDGDLFFENTI